LKGFEAIAFYNGWNISATGILIVFTALCTLSFIISQLHKILMIIEKKDDYIRKAKKIVSLSKRTGSRRKMRASRNFKESARQFNLLIRSMKDPFSLPKLITLAKKVDIARPYSTLNDLLSANIIVPDGKGYYSWDQDTYKNILEKE
jgi:hypothetical protein